MYSVLLPIHLINPIKKRKMKKKKKWLQSPNISTIDLHELFISFALNLWAISFFNRIYFNSNYYSCFCSYITHTNNNSFEGKFTLLSSLGSRRSGHESLLTIQLVEHVVPKLFILLKRVSEKRICRLRISRLQEERKILDIMLVLWVRSQNFILLQVPFIGGSSL